MGENDTSDLQRREDALAEQYAAEDGGTGLGSVKNGDTTGELTDIGYNPLNEITNRGTGVDDFDMVDRFDDNEDEISEDIAARAAENDVIGSSVDEEYTDDFDDDEENDETNEDEGDEDEEEYDGDEDEEAEDVAGEGNDEGEVASDGATGTQGGNKKGDFDGVIKWDHGHISLELFATVWEEGREFAALRSYMNKIDEMLEKKLIDKAKGELCLTLRSNYWVKKIFGNWEIRKTDAILILATSPMKKLLSLVIAFGDGLLITQQYQQMLVIAKIRSNLKEIINNDGLFKRYMEKAVPLINKKYRKKAENKQ